MGRSGERIDGTSKTLLPLPTNLAKNGNQGAKRWTMGRLRFVDLVGRG